MKNKKELAEQLRVGNLLYYKNTKDVAKVELIHNNHFDCRDEYGSFTPNGNYEPITLTEEILLKCGFEKGFLNWFKLMYKNKGISFNIVSNMICVESYYEGEKKGSIQILGLEYKHLHQLQNLYHSLTGQELKIEL